MLLSLYLPVSLEPYSFQQILSGSTLPCALVVFRTTPMMLPYQTVLSGLGNGRCYLLSESNVLLGTRRPKKVDH